MTPAILPRGRSLSSLPPPPTRVMSHKTVAAATRSKPATPAPEVPTNTKPSKNVKLNVRPRDQNQTAQRIADKAKEKRPVPQQGYVEDMEDVQEESSSSRTLGASYDIQYPLLQESQLPQQPQSQQAGTQQSQFQQTQSEQPRESRSANRQTSTQTTSSSTHQTATQTSEAPPVIQVIHPNQAAETHHSVHPDSTAYIPLFLGVHLGLGYVPDQSRHPISPQTPGRILRNLVSQSPYKFGRLTNIATSLYLPKCIYRLLHPRCE